jgi:hypothetical protein
LRSHAHLPVRISPTLVDDAIDAYVDWRGECEWVRTSYDRWTSASTDEARRAFSVYRAALEREERASRVYAECIARVESAR